MNELEIFKNEEFGEVRTLLVNGEPYFVGRDICAMFGDSNSVRSIGRIDSDDKSSADIIDSMGRKQTVIIVNESGLYSLLFSMKPQKSNKRNGVSDEYPIEIKERIYKLSRFKKWVTSEVLPSIRKHGAYMTNDVIEKTLTDPDYLIQLATVLKEERLARQLAEKKLEEQKPLVDFANHVTSSSDSVDVGEFSKIVKNEHINIGRNRLFQWLRECKYLMSNNVPYQKYIDNGYFDVIETTKDTSYGTKIFSKTLVKGKGQVVLVEKLRKEFS